MTITSYEAGTLHQVCPGDLILERNIRDAKPDADLVDSIRAVGVLQPVTARTTDDGRLVLRMGFRRTLAAIEAGRDTIPVYVAGHVDDTDADEIDRIITQRDENTHRAGLTPAEEAGVVGQLALLGLSADEIATQARIAKDRVTTALKVTSSKLAKGAVDRYADLTLDQAAAVAEFEDDPETFKGLVATALQRPAQFAHVLQQKRDDRDRPILFAAAREELEAAGVRVLDKDLGYRYRVDALKDKKSGEDLTVKSHATCPGRAATLYLTEVWTDDQGNVHTDADLEDRHEHLFHDARTEAVKAAVADGEDPDEAVDDDALWDSLDPRAGLTRGRRAVVDTWYCLDPDTHGHVYRWGTSEASTPKKPAAEMSDAEREQAAKDRRLVIDNNKAWDSAEVVRRDWLKILAKFKTPPKGTAAFIATALSKDRAVLTDYRVTAMTNEILGAKNTIDTLLKGASDGRAQVIALVQILAAYEASLTRDSWRGNGETSPCGRYLRFIELAGYTLSDVEKYATSQKTV